MPDARSRPFLAWIRTGPVPYLRPVVAGACAIILAVVVARYLDKAAKPSRLGDTTRTAYLRWRPQVHDLFAGVDVYRAADDPGEL